MLTIATVSDEPTPAVTSELSPTITSNPEPTSSATEINTPMPTPTEAPFVPVAINEANFPDAVFRQYVLDNVDQDKDGELSESEIAQCTIMEVSEYGINSITGVEHFSKLSRLDCNYNNLNGLDVSKNTALVRMFWPIT